MPGNIVSPPPSVIATWPTPNYDDSTGVRRTWLPKFAIIFLVTSSILTFIRIGLRARSHGGGFGWDDVFLLPGWLLLLGLSVCAIWSSEAGFIDRHTWDMKFEKFEPDALNAWIGQLIFITGTCCVKISVLLFYRRMVTGTFERRWKWAIWVAIVFTTAYTLVLFFILLFNCIPTEAYWRSLDPTYKKPWKCIDTKWVNYVAGILALVSDFYSVCLPAVMLRPLEMPRRQKIGLNAIFASGLVTVIAAGFRTNALIDLGRKSDLTWTGFWVYFWSLLEYNVGIICACAPSLRVFFRKYLKGSLQHSMTSMGSSKKVLSTTCGKGDDESDMLPARGIELRRPWTQNSDTPFASNHNRTRSDGTQEEDMDIDEHPERHSNRKRHGIIHRPRECRSELAQNETFFDSKSTIYDSSIERAATSPPIPIPPAANGIGIQYPDGEKIDLPRSQRW